MPWVDVLDNDGVKWEIEHVPTDDEAMSYAKSKALSYADSKDVEMAGYIDFFVQWSVNAVFSVKQM